MPHAKIKKYNYENVWVDCPICQFENIFNRVSDLKEHTPIVSKKVNCFNCKSTFNISGDEASAAYAMLIGDCYDLKQEKKYAYCILNLAQSFEAFFSLYLRVELLYKPFARSDAETDELNRVSQVLYDKIKKKAFNEMRALFLNYILLTKVLMKRDPSTLDESETLIVLLSSEMPSKSLLQKINDKTLARLLLCVHSTEVATRRNEVVHHRAQRPTLSEVEKLLKETRKTLFSLEGRLGLLTDNVNWYRNKIRKQTS